MNVSCFVTEINFVCDLVAEENFVSKTVAEVNFQSQICFRSGYFLICAPRKTKKDIFVLDCQASSSLASLVRDVSGMIVPGTTCKIYLTRIYILLLES